VGEAQGCQSKPRYTLGTSPDRCTGCTSCVLTCSFEHDGSFSLNRSRIRVEREEEQAVFTPQVCIQCPERFCIEACPVGALSIHEVTGAIAVDGGTCTGCQKCAVACPHGGIHFDNGCKVPLVCDLCGGNPRCIEVCQMPQALTLTTHGDSNQ